LNLNVFRTAIQLPALLVFGVIGNPAQTADPSSAEIEFFENRVRPVLVEHCFQCHSSQAKKLKGGLLLESREGLVNGGDSGPAIVAGKPEASRLIEAIGYQSVELRMPPKGKLSDGAIADLTAWVKMGAPWPREAAPKSRQTEKEGFNLAKRKQEHWAWRPVRPQDPPAVQNNAWPRDPVDRFVLRKLEEKGLTPAPQADRRTLLRRVYFDLIGLPPSPPELDAFLADQSPRAWEHVVDQLLASEHFGERWGRRWLDLVRYAETRGHEFDYANPNAYQYRDYIIRALNADVAYDQLVTEHIAGDLVNPPRTHPTEGFNESILGTGFWFLGEEVHSPVDTRQDEADRMDNRIDVLTKAFLGMTVSCARCHDHKFDAISTKDYYALLGFLESSSFRQVRFDSLDHNRRVAVDLDRWREINRIPVQRALAKSFRPGVERLADCLLGAREVVVGGGKQTTKRGADSLNKAYLRRLQAVAEAREIDSDTLDRSIAVLHEAAANRDDPLHAWAAVAMCTERKKSKPFEDRVKPLLDEWRRRESEVAATRRGVEVVIDYAKAHGADWLPDDVTFGLGPVRPGDVRFGRDPCRPLSQIINYDAAEKDSTWDGWKLASGVEGEPGLMGDMLRAGRTIRTPSFKVTAGKVFYLVKGAGRAYAAVDSHVMIAGPLHAQLLLHIQAGKRFQWIGHDLSSYKGHRAYIEFTARDGAEFAVAMVVQAASAPGSIDAPNQLLLKAMAPSKSVEDLAAAYQRLFLEVIDRLGADRIRGAEDARDVAKLAQWLIQRPELFGADQRRQWKQLIDVGNAYLAGEREHVSRIKKESRVAMAILDGSPVDEHVFIRGSPKALGEMVPRRFLEGLAGTAGLSIARGSGRLELARQLTDPSVNPLVARVIVNRVWHHLFGRGIVASVDNFGVLGDAPTHPELLDYLSARFAQEGWSIKKLIRTLVLSSTYQMSSKPEAAGDAIDPQNLNLHRMRVRRLEGEAMRDAMLALSGRLDRRLYGPPVPVYLTAFQDGRGRPASGPIDGDGRRSIYLGVRRNFLSSMLLAFDTPIPFSTMGRRTVSNVPAQALILMNDPFVHQQAAVWAQRLLQRSMSPTDRICEMYVSAFGRPATSEEIGQCLGFLERQGQLYGSRAEHPSAWTDLAHVLFNVKEFIFVN
jgi:hypothetical protein